MLLGHSTDDEQTQMHRKLYGNDLTTDEAGRTKAQRPDGTAYSIEELLAMQLAYARDMAILASKGDKSFDTVITVR